MHLGNARTALLAWLSARAAGGALAMRVEDLDGPRVRPGLERRILEELAWLGLDWDEGPGKGGPHAPYFQTERLEIYAAQAEKLIREGKAYACTCTREELDLQREQARAEKRQYIYPGTCRDKPYDPSRRHVVRFKAPKLLEVTYTDLVKGPITRPGSTLQDEVILRSDGVPLYNFGAVVDDVTMRVNLVARGDDHVNNTAIQILLYEALGYPVPSFAHLPMILGSDKTRLSKRHGATSVTAYRDMGMLPEAVVNYLARLGWSHGDQEIFTREELVKFFDLRQVGATASVFDLDKMSWVNHTWLKSLAPEELARRALPFFQAAGLPAELGPRLTYVARVGAERSKTLVELASRFRYFFETPAMDPKARQKFLGAEAKPVLQAVRDGIAATEPDTASLEKLFGDLAAARGQGLGKVAQPVRVALTGGTASPGIYDVVLILGKAETLERLDDALRSIG